MEPYIYCTIAKSGKTFTAYFKNGNKSGYSLETFQDVPDGVPLIDYRTADRVKLMKAIFATDGPSEATGYGIPLVEYLEVMRGTGATIGEIEKVYLNKYRCECGQQWEDTWSCGCNDKCPECNKEIEPYSSEEVKAN